MTRDRSLAEFWFLAEQLTGIDSTPLLRVSRVDLAEVVPAVEDVLDAATVLGGVDDGVEVLEPAASRFGSEWRSVEFLGGLGVDGRRGRRGSPSRSSAESSGSTFVGSRRSQCRVCFLLDPADGHDVVAELCMGGFRGGEIAFGGFHSLGAFVALRLALIDLPLDGFESALGVARERGVSDGLDPRTATRTPTPLSRSVDSGSGR